jgi:hypothetical protein
VSPGTILAQVPVDANIGLVPVTVRRGGVSSPPAKVTGMSADFWLGLQLDWDLWHALRSKDVLGIAKLSPLGRTG